jgi:hypothetical protein
MTDKEAYECAECKNQLVVKVGSPRPECCGKAMIPIPLEMCTSAPADAEHARPMDDEELCDDSRGG